MIIYDKNNNQIIDLTSDDRSYRYKELKGENSLTLYFSLTDYIELPIGCWCEFKAERYELYLPENFKKNHSRSWEYTLVMHASYKKMSQAKIKFFTDGSYKLKFSLTATPQEFAALLVSNMNINDSDGGWSVGDCLSSAPVTIDFNHDYCDVALSKIGEAFKTESEVSGKVISIGPVEKMKSSAIDLSYGYDCGVLGGIERTQYDDSKVFNRICIQGGSDNIDASAYGSTTLLLPKSTQVTVNGIVYKTDIYGSFVERVGRVGDIIEDSLDVSDIRPEWTGTVSTVEVIDDSKSLYDIFDTLIPDELDFSKCRISGEKMTIIFQTGDLAGKEFDIEQTETSLTGYIHTKVINGETVPERRFKIVPISEQGINLPQGALVPAVGDSFAVFHISLPEYYYTAAEQNALAKAIEYLVKKERPFFTYKWTLEELYAKRNWGAIGGFLDVGYFVSYHDDDFLADAVDIRIISVKDFINKPKSPVIEISNSVSGTSFSTIINKIPTGEQKTDRLIQNSVKYTKRSLRDAQETIKLLQGDFDYFSGNIQPVSIETMMLLAGSESLQFIFVDSKTEPVRVGDGISYNSTLKKLSIPAGIIQHKTLGINSITSSHKATDFKYWDMTAYQSAVLADSTKSYRVYAKVEQSGAEGSFLISETSIGMYDVAGYYHLLIGYLNSEHYKNRSIARMYGFTEILPGQVTTDMIISADGNSFFDFVNNALKLGEKLSFNVNGDGKLIIKGLINQDSGGNESPAIVDRGDYDPEEPYFNGNIFQFNGSSYQCIKNAPAGTSPANIEFFKVLAAKGETGATGATLYTWIMYADDATGTGISNYPTGKTYIGLAYNKTTAVKSTDKADYSWSLIQGTQGIPGEPGANGITTYTWLKYSISATGEGLTDDPTGMTYIGLAYNKTTATESTIASDYTWSLIKGDKGDTGATGQKGDTGNTGASGVNARTVTLLADVNVVRYNSAGVNPSPSTIVITASAHNTAGSVYYEFLKNSDSVQNTTANTYNYTPQASAGDMPDVIQVNIREISNNSAILASDVISIIALVADSKLLTVAQTNQYVQLAANYVGVVPDYSGAGNIVNVYEGDTILVPTSEAQPQAGEWHIYDVQATNITAGSQTILGNNISIGAALAMTADYACIEYIIHGKRFDGREFEIVVSQRFTKFRNGADGKGHEFIFTRTSKSDAPTKPAEGQTKSPDSPASNYQDDDWFPLNWTDNPAGPDHLFPFEWVSKRDKTNGIWGALCDVALWTRYTTNGADGTNGLDNVELSLSQESVILSCMASGDPRTGTLPLDIYAFTTRGGQLQDNDGLSITPASSSALEYTITEHSGGDGITKIHITGISENVSQLTISANIDNGSSPIPTVTKKLTITKQLDGYAGPGLIARGAYNSSTTYHGEQYRIDVVSRTISGLRTWYKTRVTAGSFSGIEPGVTAGWESKWEEGDSFGFVAADTAFLENANVAEFIFNGGKLKSQYNGADGEPNLELNGVTGEIKAQNTRIKGHIEAITGRVGQFTLESGNIIGRNIDGLERVRLTTENINSLAGMTGGINYTGYGLADGGEKQVFLNNDENYPPLITSDHFLIESGLFQIPYDTTAKVSGGQLGAVFTNESAIISYELTQTARVYDSNNDLVWTGNVDESFTILAGTYNAYIEVWLSAVMTDQGATGCSYGMDNSSSRGVEYSGSIARSEVGSNGLCSVFSPSTYMYFSEDFGFELRKGNAGIRVTDFGVKKYNGTSWVEVAGTGGITIEEDPVFAASPAWGITLDDKAHWNAAFGYGNHAAAGYLTQVTSASIVNALGYTPYNASNPANYISGITTGMISTALGYNPYNPANFGQDALYYTNGHYATLASLTAHAGLTTTAHGLGASAFHTDSYFQTALTFGIADGNAVKIDSEMITNNNYAKFTANGLVGRSVSEVLGDIGAVSIHQISYGGGDANAIYNIGVYAGYNIVNAPQGDFGFIHIPTTSVPYLKYALQIGSGIGTALKFRTTDDVGAGTWYTLWGSNNANSSTVDWAAKDVTASGYIQATNFDTAFTIPVYGYPHNVAYNSIFSHSTYPIVDIAVGNSGQYDNASYLRFQVNDRATSNTPINALILAPDYAIFNSNIQATTAKLTDLGTGYIPYHISDAAGLGDSCMRQSAGLFTSTIPIKISSNSYSAKLILDDPNISSKVPIEFRANDILKWEFGQRPIEGSHDFAFWNYDGPEPSGYYAQLWLSKITGNVAIGSTSPFGYKLYVNGTGCFNGALTIAGTNETLTLNSGSSATVYQSFIGGIERFRIGWSLASESVANSNTARIINDAGDTLNIFARGDVASRIRFYTSDATTYAQRMEISSSGVIIIAGALSSKGYTIYSPNGQKSASWAVDNTFGTLSLAEDMEVGEITATKGIISRLTTTGTDPYGNTVGFNETTLHSAACNIGTMIGFQSMPSISSAATVDTRIGFYVKEVQTSIPNNITNNYGIYVSELTKGTGENYAIFTAYTTPSYFGGNVQSGGNITALSFIKAGATGTNLLVDDGTVISASSFLTSSDLNGYATQTWVGQQSFVTGTPWTGLGYITGIADASAFIAGKVSTGTQTFAGAKTFKNRVTSEDGYLDNSTSIVANYVNYNANSHSAGTSVFNSFIAFADNNYLYAPIHIDQLISFQSSPAFSNYDNSVGTRIAFYAAEMILGANKIDDNFGLFVGELTNGYNNYAVFTEGSTPSYFTGNVSAAQFKKIGGTGTNILLDDGSVVSASNFLTSSDLYGYATESWVNSNYQTFPGFGTTILTAAYGNHTHSNYVAWGSANSISGVSTLIANEVRYFTLTNLSDIRLKKNITPISDGISLIEKLRPVIFEWNNRIDTLQVGLIANEVQEVMPYAVRPAGDYLGIEYNKIIPYLIQGEKDLYAEIKFLKNRVSELENKLLTLN